MCIMEEAKFNGLGVYVGGQVAPAGSYWNPGTNSIKQNNATDAALPAKVTPWIKISTNGADSLSTSATNINGLIGGLAYTSSSIHAYTSADDSVAPGTGANDA